MNSPELRLTFRLSSTRTPHDKWCHLRSFYLRRGRCLCSSCLQALLSAVYCFRPACSRTRSNSAGSPHHGIRSRCSLIAKHWPVQSPSGSSRYILFGYALCNCVLHRPMSSCLLDGSFSPFTLHLPSCQIATSPLSDILPFHHNLAAHYHCPDVQTFWHVIPSCSYILRHMCLNNQCFSQR